MKSSARAVVIGGGVVGASVLYHLAKIGWTDVTAAREERTDVRFDLARGRRHAHVQRRSQHLAAAEIHDRPLPRDRADLRPVLRLASERRSHAGRQRQASSTASKLIMLARAISRDGDRDDLARRGDAAQSADRQAALHRRAVARGRRALRSVGHDAGLCEGGAQARRVGGALHARARAVAAHRRHMGRGHRQGHGACRARRQLPADCGRAKSVTWSASSCRCSRWSTTTSSPRTFPS